MQTTAAITIVTHQLSFIAVYPSFPLQNQGEGLEAKTIQEGMHTDLASCKKKTQFRTHVDSLHYISSITVEQSCLQDQDTSGLGG